MPKRKRSTPRKDTVDSGLSFVEAQYKRDLAKQRKLEKESNRNRIRQLRRDNEEEDQNIAKLEKMLKINKSKNKKRLIEKMFSCDGLDYALELCNDLENDKIKKTRKQQQQTQQDEWNEEDLDEHVNDDSDNFNEEDLDETMLDGENSDSEDQNDKIIQRK